jgi:phosphatidylinositol alpha 1,6-mannosyltransferase
VRIAYVTESFPPVVNGVAITAMRVAEHLVRRGHKPLVIAPEAGAGSRWPDEDFCFPVARMPSVGLPVYPDFRFGLPGPHIRSAIADHGAELVHLAGPVMFGASGGAAGRSLGLPVVAVYATDMAAYARAYHLGRLGESVAWKLTRRTHNAVDLTLSPSTATAADLTARGFERVSVWGRGVDTDRFDPARRDHELRARLAPGGELIVGYVGRLATEKRLDLLTGVAALPGVRLVIVGAGPTEAIARRILPSAVFLGQSHGAELARIYASLDIFVHSGPHETFGNTLQEAAASGLPVVAPAAGGPLDIVEDGVTGFLVTPGDSGALAGAVATLAADWQLRVAQGHAARRSMLERSWPARGDELIGHYEAVLGRTDLHGVIGAAA